MDMEELKAENAKLKTEAEASATQVKTLQADLEAAQKLNEEASTELTQVKEQLTATQESIQTLSAEKTQLETDLSAAREQVQTLEAESKTVEEKAAEIAATMSVETTPADLPVDGSKKQPVSSGEGFKAPLQSIISSIKVRKA